MAESYLYGTKPFPFFLSPTPVWISARPCQPESRAFLLGQDEIIGLPGSLSLSLSLSLSPLRSPVKRFHSLNESVSTYGWAGGVQLIGKV